MNPVIRRIVFLSVVFLLLWSMAARAQAPAGLSAKERLGVFHRVWRLVNERYYDAAFNGADWKTARDRYQPRVEAAASDRVFYELLEQMVGELRDAHTHVRNPLQRYLRDHLQHISAGVSFYEVEGQAAVLDVGRDSVAARAGIVPGMILRAIDGRPVAERLAELRRRVGMSSSERAARLLVYSYLLEGEPGTEVSLTLTRETGNPLTVKLPRMIAAAQPRVTAYRLPSGFGYMHLNRWKAPAAALVRAELERMRDWPGLILDLRGNGGGETGVVLETGTSFFAEQVSFGQFFQRTGKVTSLKTGRPGSQLSGAPLVILVNEGSASGSEMYAAALRDQGRALIVGQQSCGCLLAAERERLPGGGELSLSIFGYLTPRGHRVEGAGITPDFSVPLRLADLRAHRDSALEKAEEVLGNMAAGKERQ
ncbi:MAG: S41 family peptidase [Blastocatellia bacterium]